MKGLIPLIFIAAINITPAAESQKSKQPILAGTWNITSTITEDTTCTGANIGDISAYVWIISQTSDGSINISVQGETTFPKLFGHWNNETKELIVSGKGTSYGTHSWFKLKADEKGALSGVRRFLSTNKSIDRGVCFADSLIEAEKQ